jgi:3-hydroxyisobutyrate dehydrogenase
MGHVALLGTGLLGAGFVQSFQRRGVAVKIWNRSADKAQALAGEGVAVASDPADCVRGADRIHLVLSDDAAVDGVLDQAWGELRAPVLDHTTVSPAGVVRRVARFEASGRTYVHAPVFMNPQNARDASGMMLVAGDKALVEPFFEVLRPMTGKLWHVGERVDQAAAVKLFGNAMLITMVAGLADIFAMADALEVPPSAVTELFDQFNPGGLIPIRGKRMAVGQYDPASFELQMARKDVRLMIEASKDRDLAVLPGIADRMDKAIADGEGRSDYSVIGKVRRR